MGEQLKARENEIERKRSEFLDRLKIKPTPVFGPRHMDEDEFYGRGRRKKPRPGEPGRTQRNPDEDDF